MASEAMIDDILLNPLAALGLPRHKDVSAKAMRDGYVRLRRDLQKLSEAQLRGVAADADIASQQAGVQLTAASLLEIARSHGLDDAFAQKMRDGIASTMRSAAGAAAQREDYAVELLAYLRRIRRGCAVGEFLVARLKKDAANRKASLAKARARGDSVTVARLGNAYGEAAQMVLGEGGGDAA